MSEVGDAVASAIEALKELAPNVKDLKIAPRIDSVVQALYALQHELDQLDDE